MYCQQNEWFSCFLAGYTKLIAFMMFSAIAGVNSLYVIAGRGASGKCSAVGFCLGSGLFGSYNSD